MIPYVIHQTSPLLHLTWEEERLLSRTRRILNGWEYKLSTNADLEAVIRSNFPQHLKKFKQISRGIVISDIGRYALLFDQGGLYLDTDYKLLRAPDRYLDASCTLPVEEGTLSQGIKTPNFKLGNAFLASIPGYVLWKDFLNHILTTRSVDDLNNGNPVLMTGPVALTEFVSLNLDRYDGLVMPQKTEFYPNLSLSNFYFEGTSETFGVHLCWGSWRGKQSLQKYRNIVRRKITCIF